LLFFVGSVFRIYIYIYIEIAACINIYIFLSISKSAYIYLQLYMLSIQTENRRPAIFLNPFTVSSRANGSLSFVHLFTKEQMEVIHLQVD
jgi:hypothetical protein